MYIKVQRRLEDFMTVNTKVTVLDYRGKGKEMAEFERRSKKSYSSNRTKALKETGHGPNVPRDRALNKCPVCKKQGTACICKED